MMSNGKEDKTMDRIQLYQWIAVSFATGKTFLYHVRPTTHIGIGSFKCNLEDLVGHPYGSVFRPEALEEGTQLSSNFVEGDDSGIEDQKVQSMGSRKRRRLAKAAMATGVENSTNPVSVSAKLLVVEKEPPTKMLEYGELQEQQLLAELKQLRSRQEKLSKKDNRNLTDDDTNQLLNYEQVEQMKQSGKGSEHIVKLLQQNSTTFDEKTVHAQDKYLENKNKKHSMEIQVRKPNSRIIGQVIWDRSKISGALLSGLRPLDSLPLMLYQGNVTAHSRVMVSDTVGGFLLGSVLERLNGHGEVISLFVGPTYSENNFLPYFNLTSDQLKTVQKCDITKLLANYEGDEHIKVIEEAEKRRLAALEEQVEDNPDSQRQFDEWKTKKEADKVEHHAQRLTFAKLRTSKADSLLICSKYYPERTLIKMFDYLVPGGKFALFSEYIEPLVLLKESLQQQNQAINIKVVENFVRKYQVEQDRTHPLMKMNGTSGFLLYGTKTC